MFKLFSRRSLRMSMNRYRVQDRPKRNPLKLLRRLQSRRQKRQKTDRYALFFKIPRSCKLQLHSRGFESQHKIDAKGENGNKFADWKCRKMCFPARQFLKRQIFLKCLIRNSLKELTFGWNFKNNFD